MSSGPFPIESHFDLRWLAPLRERLVEPHGLPLATAADVRRARDALSRMLLELDRDFIIATACLLEAQGQLPLAAASPEDLRVFPRFPVPPGRLIVGPARPALLEAWVDLGAWVCGEPGWDRDLGCPRVPLLLPLARMRGRRARQLLSRAA